MYLDNSAGDIASKLGRTVGAVVGRAHNLGISERRNVWSKRELDLLKRLYPSNAAEQIAEQLGRPVQATRKKIVLLGLRKRFRYDERHRVVKGTKEKLCSKCRIWKVESQFRKDRRSKDGLHWRCKECEYEYARKRHQRIRKSGRRNLRYEECHRIVDGVREKLCVKCRKWKRESGFYKSRARKDGLTARCQKCSYEATA
jgi:hypothetical protein